MTPPPSDGADQVTAADRSPASAATPVGAPGAAGGAELTGRTTTEAISHVVFAPVFAVAAAWVPAGTVRSSISRSMSLRGERLTRCVYPVPAVSVAPKPESA